MAYEEMDVDKYVFMAVLDTRTSTICQSLDNKVFELKDKREGVNFPPMHPNCRSTTRAYMGAEIEATLKRRARNPYTNENEIIDNMSYSEWAKIHGLDKPKAQKTTKPEIDGLKNQPKDAIIKDKSKIIPAKTVEEAQQYAGKFADSVSFAGVTNIDGVNTVNETLDSLTQKYPTKKLSTITTNDRFTNTKAESCYDTLEISTNFLNENPKGDFNGWAERVKKNEALLKEYKGKYLGDARYDQSKLKIVIDRLEKEKKFARYRVSEHYGVSGTITHEYGHILSDQYIGMINGRRANPNFSNNASNELYKLRQRVIDTYNKAQDTGDIYNISMYADKDADEFFAETFTMYDKGEKLPDYITEMLKEVLNFGKL